MVQASAGMMTSVTRRRGIRNTREPGEGAPLARRRLRRSTMSAATKNSTAGQLAGSASLSYTRVAAVETSAVDDAHAADDRLVRLLGLPRERGVSRPVVR